MKPKFHKTEHFLYRQWDRGVGDDVVNRVTSKINIGDSKPTIIIVSFKFLKSLKVQISKNAHLIIVASGRTLLTLFFVDDLYAYLKSKKGNLSFLIYQ